MVGVTMDPSKWKSCKNLNFTAQIQSQFLVKLMLYSKQISKISFQHVILPAAITRASITAISRSFSNLVGGHVVEICVRIMPGAIFTVKVLLFQIARTITRNPGSYRL